MFYLNGHWIFAMNYLQLALKFQGLTKYGLVEYYDRRVRVVNWVGIAFICGMTVVQLVVIGMEEMKV